MSPPAHAPRLVLGTAQFGLAYGITNQSGRISEAAAAEVLARAEAGGIDTLDTASAYGAAEAVLGRLGAAARFRIVTKLAAPPEGLANAARAAAARLGRAPDAILLHDANALAGAQAPAMARALLDLREAGLTAGIGVSVYAPDQLEAALAQLRPDLVQLPFNLFDRRFVPAIARLAGLGVEVHARSLFLQGALLAPATPPALGFAESRFAAFRALLARHRIGALEACLAAGLAVPGLSRLVIGVAGADELAAILACRPPPVLPEAFATLACNDPGLIEPSRWPRP